MRSRPEVVAHRGASEVEAEHTLAAYERALDDGADGLECDVRLTRDGVLVCVHDRRVDRTSSGRGVVSTMELSDLADLDFGSWHSPGSRAEHDLGLRAQHDVASRAEHDLGLRAQHDVGSRAQHDSDEAPDRDRTSVLTLERLLQMVADVERPVRLAIETKHPTRYAGLVESTLVEILSRHGLATAAGNGKDTVRVMSFAPVGLRRVRQLAPDLPTVHLMRRVPLPRRDGTICASATIAGPSLEGLRAYPGYVARAHARGHAVHVWTVDEPDDVDFLVGLGVDVLITNRPAEVVAQVRQAVAP